jgi:hypothetical protein
MADQTVNIKVKVTKEGSGVQDTVNDLKKIESAATSAQTAVANPIKAGGFGNLLNEYPELANLSKQLGAEQINVANSLDALAVKGNGAAGAMGLLGPALLAGGIAAAGAAVAIGKLAYNLGTEGEAVLQTQKKFVAFAGGSQQAAEALQAMQSATDGGMSSMDAMTYSAMLLSMGLAKNGEEAARVSRMALMLGPAYRDAATNIQDFTMMLANQSVRRLDQFGLSVDAVKRKQQELVDAGMDKQLAFTNAVLEIGAQKMGQLEAAGVVAGTGIQQLTSAWANLRAEVGKELAPATSAFQSGLASSLNELTNSFRANSSDATTRLIGLQAQMEQVRAVYQTMLAKGADPNGPYMQQYANTLAQIEARLITTRLEVSSFGEAAGIAGVRAADGLTYTADAATAAASASQEASLAALQAAGGIDTLTGSYYRLGDATDAAMKGVIAETKANIAAHDARLALMQSSVPGTGPGYQPSTTPYGSAELKPLASDAVSAFNESVNDGIRIAKDAAEKAASAVKARWDAFASTVTTALDAASAKAKGLFDLGGGAGGARGIVTEPGKNGPFEALYRLTDIAATQAGRAPGADTARWQQMYAGQDATGIARNFQAGNLLAKGVFENIDWGMLGQQAQQQEQASKISTYAGQAAANLTKAGKPLTAESMAAEIEKLAAKDKANLVPELQNVTKAVTDTGTTAHTDAASITDGLAAINSTLTGKQAPPPTTTTPNPPTPPGGGGPPEFAGGTPYAPGGLALVGERGPELVNLPLGARVFTAGQTDSILAGLALRSFAAGTAFAPGGLALVGERGPELVQIPQPRMAGGSGGQDQAQASAKFMTDLAKAINAKASTSQQAADALADMLVNAASANVQQGMLRQLARR